MKKSLALTLLSVLVLSATSGAMAATNKNSSGNPVANGAKKVGVAIVTPFKWTGSKIKAGWHKVTGK